MIQALQPLRTSLSEVSQKSFTYFEAVPSSFTGNAKVVTQYYIRYLELVRFRVARAGADRLLERARSLSALRDAGSLDSLASLTGDRGGSATLVLWAVQ
ncbi:hypothetical protein MSG28_003916 [Choristoneura fumiferana]|uniref:Uncharacterized protein n=1 Tax=Choristoneura fumiferana TaxID=7141 RepID=A0ACC0KHH2_CHOFU|nr:hypothetical protein MSG28_003916 [Choristoneura fumiferana]